MENIQLKLKTKIKYKIVTISIAMLLLLVITISISAAYTPAQSMITVPGTVSIASQNTVIPTSYVVNEQPVAAYRHHRPTPTPRPTPRPTIRPSPTPRPTPTPTHTPTPIPTPIPTIRPSPTPRPTPAPTHTPTPTPTPKPNPTYIVPPGTSTFKWSGITWNVRNGGTGSPGANTWSNNNVWVDNTNRLHLKITNVNGQWYVAELDSATPTGYGTYTFDVAINPNNYAINTVAGMFYYLSDTNEIDFMEYSKWNDPHSSFNSQSTIWSSSGGVSDAGYMTNVGETILTGIYSSSSIEVKRNGIRTLYYTGTIPKLGGELAINLWLYGNTKPANGLEQELILKSVTYNPNALSSSFNIANDVPVLIPGVHHGK